MGVQEGDRVLVNLAPFIGSSCRSKVQIPCQVLAADAGYVEVRTAYPFRELRLRVRSTWLEGKMETGGESARNPARSSPVAEFDRAAAGAVG
jgi:hypothetical protein